MGYLLLFHLSAILKVGLSKIKTQVWETKDLTSLLITLTLDELFNYSPM